MSSTNQREAILSAAAQLFARFGYRKTSIEDVAKRVRIGKGTIYLYFASKEELFGAIAHQIWGNVLLELTAAVKRARTPEAKLRAYVQGRAHQLIRVTKDLQVQHDLALELQEAAAPYLMELWKTERALLEGILVEGNAANAFLVPHPHALALAIQTVVRGLERSMIDPQNGPELRRAIDDLLDVLVRGITSTAGPVPDQA
jgi:AcrR family transcriptional regulator